MSRRGIFAPRRPVRDDEGSAMPLALLFVTVFVALTSVALSFISDSVRATSALSELERERIAAESGLDLTVAGLRNGTIDPSACGLSAPLSSLSGTSSVAVSCPAGTSPVADKRYSVLALDASGSGILVAPGVAAAVSGDSWSNGGVSAAGGSLTVAGDFLARGACSDGAVLESGGDGTPLCSAAAVSSAEADPGYLRRPGVPSPAATPQLVPACPSDPAVTLVKLSPGRYTDAAALNALFVACSDRDFWFEPGGYLFDFQNATDTACPLPVGAGVDPAHRLCLTSKVLAGTPKGWDPSLTGRRSVSGTWGSISASSSEWVDLPAARIVDGTSGTLTIPASTPTAVLNPSSSSTSGTALFASTSNAYAIDTTTSEVSFSGAAPTSTFEATSAANVEDFATPERARKILEGDPPPATNASLSGANTYAAFRLTSFSAGSAEAIANATLRVRYRPSAAMSNIASLPVTITRGDGTVCAPVDVKDPNVLAGTFATVTRDVSSCLDSPAAMNGASLLFEFNRASGGSNVALDVDGAVFDASTSASSTLLLGTFVPQQPALAPTKVELRVAHTESADGMNPRLILSGSGSCSFALSRATSLRTDTLDVSACVDTAAEVDNLTVSYLVDRPPSTASAAVDGVDITATYPAARPAGTFAPSASATSGAYPFDTPSNAYTLDGSSATASFPDLSPVTFEAGAASTVVEFGNPDRAQKIEGTHNAPSSSATLSGPASSNGYAAFRLSSFSAGSAEYLSGGKLKVRYRSSVEMSNISSLLVTITRGDGTSCAPVDVKDSSAPVDTFVTVTRDVSSCLDSPAALNGATLLFELNRTSTSPNLTFNVDGAVFTASTAPPLSPSRLDLSSFLPELADTPKSVVLRITHHESVDGMNQRLVLTGSGPCSFTLPRAAELRTDTLDVSACVDTAAEVDNLTVSYLADHPGSVSTSSVDALDLTITYPAVGNTPRVVQYTDLSMTLPGTVLAIDSVEVQVSGSQSSEVSTTLQATAGDGTLCAAVPVVLGTGAAAPVVDLTSCLSTPAKFNGTTLSLSFTTPYTEGTVALDGASVSVEYRPVPSRIPALGTGCDPTAPGVQWAFTGDSRLTLNGGAATLCAGPADADNPSQTVIHATDSSGCVADRTCALLRTTPDRGQLSILGGIYAPAALVSLGDTDISAPLATTGLVASVVEFTGYGLREGYAGTWISGASGSDPGFEVTLVASVERDGALADVLRARVSFGPRVRGSQVSVLEWVLL